MSVYRRMIGRELPCSVLHVLDIAVVGGDGRRQQRLKELAAIGQADAAGLCELGRGHLAKGEWGLARRRLIDTLLKRPGFVEARLMLAGVCDLLGQHDQAAEHIETVLAVMLAANEEMAAGRWSRYALLCAAGFCRERAGRWEQAIGRYTMAMGLRPTDLFAANRLVAIQLGHEELEEAAEMVREVLRAQPQDQTARICLGHVLQQTGKVAEAVWEYEQALCLEPDSWELPVEAATELQLIQNADEGIRVLEKLIGAQPHFPDLRMRLGNMYSWRGDDELARNQYSQALAMHPEYLDCHIAMARHELRMGRGDEATECLRRAIAINNQNVEACAGLGLALRRAGFAKRGAEILTSAGRIANNTAVLMTQLAKIESEENAADGIELELQGVVEQIERDELAAAMHPEWTDAKLRRAMLLRLIGRSEQARRLLKRLVKEENDCRAAWLQLGLLAAERSSGKKAAEAIGKAIAVDGGMVQLEYQLGLICCGDLEFDLTMEAVEEPSGRAAEVQRRVWGVIEEMQMVGLRRHVEQGGRAGVGVTWREDE